MPYNKTSSCLEHNLTTNEICQIMFRSSLTVSLIVGVLIPGSNEAAQATTSTKKTEKTSDRQMAASIKLNTKDKNNTILPNILNSVDSARTPIANLSLFPKDLVNTSILDRAEHGSTSSKPKTANLNRLSRTILANQNLTVSPESSTTTLAAKPTRIHIVSRGDTISKIARQYGVSKDDLVRLNQLKNSNVIFISQTLEIPSTNLASTKPLPNTQQQYTQVTSSIPVRAANKTTISSINSDRSSVAKENSYINKLTAEIEQSRERQQRPLENKNSSAYKNPKSPTDPLPNLEDARPEIKTVSLATSLNASDSQQISLSEDSIALQLPPLPPSDEYLPSAFDGYIWPAQGVLTSGYGWRWGRMHRGIDIAAPVGTPIVAAASGEVIDVGWYSGYGNLVKLKHLDGSVTLYAHNHQNLVSRGQKVNQGEQIAEMGNTGYSTGSHLHFEIHSADEAAIDPLALLDGK